jgi:hypothetical protein
MAKMVNIMFIILTSLALIALSETTLGPLAYVTIESNSAFMSARPCAADCVWRRDYVWNCGKALNQALACACDGPNNCYCSSAYASSVTSYVNECVSTNCGFDGWEAEATSMLSIYDGYCKEAMVEPSKAKSASATATAVSKVAETTADNVSSGLAAQTGTSPTATTAAATVNPTSSANPTSSTEPKPEANGLSKSDLLALATSLGIGIPSLAIAGITLCVMLKKRRRRVAAAAVRPAVPLGQVGSQMGSQVEMLPRPHTQQSQVYQGVYGAQPSQALQPQFHGQQQAGNAEMASVHGGRTYELGGATHDPTVRYELGGASFGSVVR